MIHRGKTRRKNTAILLFINFPNLNNCIRVKKEYKNPPKKKLVTHVYQTFREPVHQEYQPVFIRLSSTNKLTLK
jgi:hypothetical protein